ncbi:helix-hairpin-helix domain-containing protein [Robertkochia solimangrovi]|uniref:helix-hairpin-helix domain-containing protein n=1 Tax=Robertkochia solimangrovi TaxID=2213046 RepID=UPI0013A5607B|nr:helix-hairpin-helix domain-containing protein [Robertkochia solimangrovi]
MSRFCFSKGQRSGIFFLILILLFVNIAMVFVPSRSELSVAEYAISNQKSPDTLKSPNVSGEDPVYKFNPNYIDDALGYRLGVSATELDRIYAYRKHGKFMNSAEEFREVSEIAVGRYHKIKDLLRFPEFKADDKYGYVPIVKKRDLNAVDSFELRSINGVGKVLSARIIHYRNKLGGYSLPGQLKEVYGLKPAVAARILRRYEVVTPPEIAKLDINTIGLKALAVTPYIGWEFARKILVYRSHNGRIRSLEELTKFHTLTEDDLVRIRLYLKTE